MDRREILYGLIQSSLVLLALPSQPGLDAGTPMMAPLPIENIPAEFDIVSLGNEYLRIFPKCRDKENLMEDIFHPEREHGAGSENFASEKGVTEFLAHAIARDFDRDATLRIGGWVYAQTELKLCALHSMSSFE